MDGLLACLTLNSCKLGVHPARFCVCVCVCVQREEERSEVGLHGCECSWILVSDLISLLKAVTINQFYSLFH